MLIAYYTNKTRTIETKKSIGIEVSHFDKKELVWIPKSIITENTLKWSESNGTLIILEISNYMYHQKFNNLFDGTFRPRIMKDWDETILGLNRFEAIEVMKEKKGYKFPSVGCLLNAYHSGGHGFNTDICYWSIDDSDNIGEEGEINAYIVDMETGEVGETCPLYSNNARLYREVWDISGNLNTYDCNILQKSAELNNIINNLNLFTNFNHKHNSVYVGTNGDCYTTYLLFEKLKEVNLKEKKLLPFCFDMLKEYTYQIQNLPSLVNYPIEFKIINNYTIEVKIDIHLKTLIDRSLTFEINNANL